MRFLAILMLLAVVPAGAQTRNPAADLKGKLVTVKNKAVQPIDATPITQAKYIAFYFGAGWCGPCHKFTPDLVAFYNEMKPKHPDFDVVFVSLDHSAAEMQNYMNEMSMPWPALRWDAVKTSQAATLCGPGIPSLVVVDNEGRVLSNSFAGTTYLGPHKVLNDLRNLLTADTAAVPAATARPSAAGTPPSPSGTDWDKVFKKQP
ncbi:MAG: redoxin domain-containing protein [Verrucomicrobia bacterium]|nr:redoxin domain-containing protein [Verrucomicrobiota bacterium]